MSRVPGGNYGALVAGQGIYEQSSTPCTAVGTRLPMGDRVFFYAKAGAAIVAGQVVASDASVSGPILLADGSCVAITSPTLGDKKAITAALAVGDRGIGITHASSLDNIAAHDLQNGYIVLTDSTATDGVDQIYKIKDNTKMASDIVEILLYDEIVTATVDAATGVIVSGSLFMNVVPALIGTDEVPVGVPLIAITDNYYFWLQTWGPSLVIGIDDATIGGTDLVLDEGDAGTVTTCDTVGDPRIGIGMADVTAASDSGMVLLQMMP